MFITEVEEDIKGMKSGKEIGSLSFSNIETERLSHGMFKVRFESARMYDF